MTVIAFPARPGAPTPDLTLLGQVFAAIAAVGEPATALEITEAILKANPELTGDAVLAQTTAILEYYCERRLTAPIMGHVFRRIGAAYAYTVEFRTYMSAQGQAMALRREPLPGPGAPGPA